MRTRALAPSSATIIVTRALALPYRKPFEGENFRVSVQTRISRRKLSRIVQVGPRACATHPHTRNVHIADILDLKKFHGETFRGWFWNSEKCECFIPQRFSAIWYIIIPLAKWGDASPLRPPPHIPTPLWLVLHIRNHVVTCPFMANITQSEP